MFQASNSPTNCKIGISRDPEQRIGHLNGGSPTRLRIAHAYFTDRESAASIERATLNALGTWRLNGEWIDAPHAAISRIVEEMAETRGIVLIKGQGHKMNKGSLTPLPAPIIL